MVKSVAERVVTLTAQFASLAALGNSRQSPQPPPLPKESLYVEMREFNERNKRRNSIIVKGSRAKMTQKLKLLSLVLAIYW